MPSRFLRMLPPAEPGAGSYRTERDRARCWRTTALISIAVNAVIAFAVTAYIVGSHAWWQ